MDEFELIARFFSRPPRSASVALGVGDDAALLVPAEGHELAVSVDMLVEGRHFVAGADPEALGHKALAVNLSDLAAMGATPRWALLAGALPDADPAWLAAFANGFYAEAEAFGVDLVGGDTTRGPRNLCVTVLGEVPAGAALRRAGAHAGDDVYVSGTLGDAALAVAAMANRVTLDDETMNACRARLDRPTPRVALGAALRGVATAAIDISDGLVGDLGHILECSGVGVIVDIDRIPRSPALSAALDGPRRATALACLLAGGDDYELCFTAPSTAASRVRSIGDRIGLPLARIGTITAGRELAVRDEHGQPIAPLPRAFDHFAK